MYKNLLPKKKKKLTFSFFFFLLNAVSHSILCLRLSLHIVYLCSVSWAATSSATSPAISSVEVGEEGSRAHGGDLSQPWGGTAVGGGVGSSRGRGPGVLGSGAQATVGARDGVRRWWRSSGSRDAGRWEGISKAKVRRIDVVTIRMGQSVGPMAGVCLVAGVSNDGL